MARKLHGTVLIHSDQACPVRLNHHAGEINHRAGIRTHPPATSARRDPVQSTQPTTHPPQAVEHVNSASSTTSRTCGELLDARRRHGRLLQVRVPAPAPVPADAGAGAGSVRRGGSGRAAAVPTGAT